MRSIKKNQILNKSEKEEAREMNKELFLLTGTKFKCRTLREYYLIKLLYVLLSTLEKSDMKTYYDELISLYCDKTGLRNKALKEKIHDRTVEDFYYNYGYTQGLYQYWLKYYYPTCLNFTSFLAIYSGEELPYTVFINTSNAAFNKLIKFIENQSVEMVRNEMSYIAIFTFEYRFQLGYYYDFIWRSKNDEKTCKICHDLNGKIFRYKPELAHPNCRCTLELIKTYI